MASVALIGCGNIGFRHLQALGSGTTPTAVTVVEPNPAAHERITQYFAEVAESEKSFELLPALPAEPRSFDLAVVATTTDTRRSAVDALLDHHDTSTLILEKVLFPRVTDLIEVGDRLVERGIPAFVNCARRTWPGYETLKGELSGRIVHRIDVTGNRYGLASNAVHLLDLAEFLTGAQIEAVSAAGLAPGFVESKRAGAVEVFGTLAADLTDGSRINITCHDQDPPTVEIAVDTDAGQIVINETGGTVTAGGTSHPFVWQTVSATPWIYDDLLRTQTCSLTPYADSARQHRLFLAALRPHLGLSNAADDPCPIS